MHVMLNFGHWPRIASAWSNMSVYIITRASIETKPIKSTTPTSIYIYNTRIHLMYIHMQVYIVKYNVPAHNYRPNYINTYTCQVSSMVELYRRC